MPAKGIRLRHHLIPRERKGGSPYRFLSFSWEEERTGQDRTGYPFYIILNRRPSSIVFSPSARPPRCFSNIRRKRGGRGGGGGTKKGRYRFCLEGPHCPRVHRGTPDTGLETLGGNSDGRDARSTREMERNRPIRDHLPFLETLEHPPESSIPSPPPFSLFPPFLSIARVFGLINLIFPPLPFFPAKLRKRRDVEKKDCIRI